MLDEPVTNDPVGPACPTCARHVTQFLGVAQCGDQAGDDVYLCSPCGTAFHVGAGSTEPAPVRQVGWLLLFAGFFVLWVIGISLEARRAREQRDLQQPVEPLPLSLHEHLDEPWPQRWPTAP